MVWNRLILIGNSTLIPNIPLCSYVKMGWNCHTKNLEKTYCLVIVKWVASRESKRFTLSRLWECGFRGYLLVCSYSLHSITEKCLEMGWNCQNTLGSSVSYRILRESKRFTLSRYEMWVSWVPTGLFVFSAFDNRKMSRNGLKLSKYVRK